MSKKLPAIPFHHFGGQGKTIHFAHANGYPPEGYQQFIQPFLAQHQVIASKYRPLWGGQPPSSVKNWDKFADDMIRFMEEQGLKNVIGMGHSMGGVISVIAAIKRPDLFSQLVLLDPVVFESKFFFWAKFLPNYILKKINPAAQQSMKRRDKWASKAEVFELWRPKRVFSKFSDQVLKDFIGHSIIPNGKGGVTLAYSKEWETQVYLTAPYIFDKLCALELPIIVIKGETSNVITSKLWQEWQDKQPQTQFVEFKEAGHLVPMEYPEKLAGIILGMI